MSTSRIFSSVARTVARRTAVPAAHRHTLMRSVARRYASSGHGGSAGAEKTSDLPWLIGSVGITVPAVAWLLASGPSKKPAHDDHHGAPVPDEEKAPAVESGADDSSSDSSSDSDSGTDTPSSSDNESDSESPNPPTNQLPTSGNPKATHSSSQTGRETPPPSSDNTDMATNYEEKKQAQEEYKDMIRKKDTKVATSSSDVPSKKGSTEHPREDPLKGEGEGVKKGGPE
ncbi:uncharacterized protein F4822DRAFT_189661 [Hypoxylon trugodes]|uniref:uncharacterized protein n=1 Tax=Hypoxylon trugodes TaxID=326681 RepID=UPI00219A0A16|nr:uncharacterized protein F4822DRAFT_189661 [Hypoxylon trugodes]KAI1391562.1 hypothetical protein F4822DRAFT_189661 [Hypoxylon trugodes]